MDTRGHILTCLEVLYNQGTKETIGVQPNGFYKKKDKEKGEKMVLSLTMCLKEIDCYLRQSFTQHQGETFYM